MQKLKKSHLFSIISISLCFFFLQEGMLYRGTNAQGDIYSVNSQSIIDIGNENYSGDSNCRIVNSHSPENGETGKEETNSKNNRNNDNENEDPKNLVNQIAILFSVTQESPGFASGKWISNLFSSIQTPPPEVC